MNKSFNKAKKSLVLASSSPRRLDLLSQINIKPDLVIAANIDESPLKRELPKDYSIRIAKNKALKVLENKQVSELQPAIILSGDTVVALGRRIIPKAQDNQQVEQFLKLLSGRRHQVYSSVCIIDDKLDVKIKTAITTVKFKRLEKQEIDLYLQSNEGVNKAGGYAIQGLGAVFVKFVSGSYSAVVGLPIYETNLLLKGCNFR